MKQIIFNIRHRFNNIKRDWTIFVKSNMNNYNYNEVHIAIILIIMMGQEQEGVYCPSRRQCYSDHSEDNQELGKIREL